MGKLWKRSSGTEVMAAGSGAPAAKLSEIAAEDRDWGSAVVNIIVSHDRLETKVKQLIECYEELTALMTSNPLSDPERCYLNPDFRIHCPELEELCDGYQMLAMEEPEITAASIKTGILENPYLVMISRHGGRVAMENSIPGHKLPYGSLAERKIIASLENHRAAVEQIWRNGSTELTLATPAESRFDSSEEKAIAAFLRQALIAVDHFENGALTNSPFVAALPTQSLEEIYQIAPSPQIGDGNHFEITVSEAGKSELAKYLISLSNMINRIEANDSRLDQIMELLNSAHDKVNEMLVPAKRLGEEATRLRSLWNEEAVEDGRSLRLQMARSNRDASYLGLGPEAMEDEIEFERSFDIC